MKKYRDVSKRRIYIHNPEKEVNPVKYQYKYIYISIGITPTGRESKYYFIEKTNTSRNVSNYRFPKIKKGYKWAGPFLYGEYPT